jgi:hypothetical protein
MKKSIVTAVITMTMLCAFSIMLFAQHSGTTKKDNVAAYQKALALKTPMVVNVSSGG